MEIKFKLDKLLYIRFSLINRVNTLEITNIESFALYDSRLLKVLYYKGYVQLVLKILVKLQ